MRKVELSEIRDIAQYEKLRDAERARIIEHKRARRVALGPNLTLLFEDHATVLFQIQEMMRTERIVDDARIQDEIDTYNALVPDPGELSATLFIEIPDISRMTTEQMRAAVRRFQGLEEGHVRLEVAGVGSPALFEAGHTSEEKMAAVHYVRFRLPSSAADALRDASQPARLVCTHPLHPATAELSPATRAQLASDLD